MNTQKMMPKDAEGKDTTNEGRTSVKLADRPTIILKTREGESRAVSPSQRNGNKRDVESSTNITSKLQDPARPIFSPYPEMTCSVKFMDENMQLCENVLEFLQDQQEFLVIGCLGVQGVGKSTIMSYLTSNYGTPNIFPTQDINHHERGAHCTTGIDLFVTKSRVIYLDTQPILSGSTIDYTMSYDQKKSSTDFVNTETNLELQSLQFAAFLFSVCHVVIFVQDWFVDPNLVRFLQTAEMLKPSSTTNMDQDYIEYYPHIIFLQNKAEFQDFMPHTLERMEKFYNKVLSSSRLQTHSIMDEGELNLFLMPRFGTEGELVTLQNGRVLLDELKAKIHQVPRNSMTPSSLTEKNWYHYVSKVMDAIKKGHLSSEYGRLMP